MSEFWTSVWNVAWLFFWSFAVVAYLIALFNVVVDLFRDEKLNGWLKALWILFLIFVPFLTVLVYLIARGTGMAARSQRAAQRAEAETTEYIRGVASTSSSDEIQKAQALFEAGTIDEREFAALKEKALR